MDQQESLNGNLLGTQMEEPGKKTPGNTYTFVYSSVFNFYCKQLWGFLLLQ